MAIPKSGSSRTLSQIGAAPKLSLIAQRTGLNGEFGTSSGSGNPFLMTHSRHLCPGGADAISLVYSGFQLTPQEAALAPGCYQAASVTYSGGSGYAAGDIDIFNTSATNGMAPVKVQIVAVSSGVPTIVRVIDGGLITTLLGTGLSPSSTTGSGTGATATFTWNAGAYGVRASIEPVWNTQTFTGQNAIEPVTFASKADGQQNINILVPCGGFAESDLIPINVPVGGAIGIRATYVGNILPYGRRPIASYWGATDTTRYELALANPNNTYSPGDLAVSNTSVSTSGANDLLQPMLILGIPKTPLPSVIAAFADSRCQGSSTGTGAISSYDILDNDGNSSWFEKSMASSGIAFWPWANFARGNDRASYAIGSSILAGRIQRLKALELAQPTAVYVNLTINDFIAQETIATVLAYEQQLISEIRATGVKYVFTDTTDPNTSSTDGWATTANQSLNQTQSTNIATRNTGLFSGSYNPGYDFVIDQRPNVEFFSNGVYTGKWLPAVTGDGVHCNPATILLKAATAMQVIAASIAL